MSIKKLPLFRQPREKLLRNGADTLSDIELVAILLGSGSKKRNAIELAYALLPHSHVRDLTGMTKQVLMKRKGIGPVRAATLIAAQELGERLYEQAPQESILSTRDAINLLSSIRDKKREYFVALYLNARQQLIEKRTISIGSLSESIVHPREVFAPALSVHAASVIVGHNHPSGSSDPSHADILLTKRLVEAGRILGVNVIDHVILATKNTTSLRELQLIQ